MSLSPAQLQTIKPLPSQDSAIPDGQYVVKCDQQKQIVATDGDIKAEVWFRTPALTADTIRSIHSLQLYVESHDQGYADDESAGNWTWFEIAILENESAETAKINKGVELVWLSHRNNFLTRKYEWKNGGVYDESHPILSHLEAGNVLAVRQGARFAGWANFAKTGYLVFNLGRDIHHKPIHYGNFVAETQGFQSALNDINKLMNPKSAPSIPQGVFRADAINIDNEARPLRVLSLDGGGARGLASLHLLKGVLDKVTPGKKPYEIFDMIGGTSTGGLIAIMLGRLHMSVAECIKKYEQFMEKIFYQNRWTGGKKGRFLWDRHFYDAKDLENVVKELIREKLGRDDVLLDEEKPACKVFVTAVRKDAANNRGPVLLRSYKHPHLPSTLPNIKLWEAARATSAAPVYFKSIRVGDYELVDGSLGANNPLGWLWTEVLGVFGPARESDCFLSIGTGISSNQPILDPGRLGDHNVESAFASAACNAEIMHVLFRTLIHAFAPRNMQEKYWRLNVGKHVPEKIVDGKKVLDNYEGVGELDDVSAVLNHLVKLAEKVVEEEKDTIQRCALALDHTTGIATTSVR
ncbi:hypothetical protein ASPWEDRAFT_31438 [Aspergillus wentii DTO 134E9]|uniref:PNPLA domain-containing protein n=1 Tax=Aspergillus wentii DTO 134E9 TaxID=1073089 RepID=A0A1L9RCE9_ASPWE|nr:uncharacterized protein ASPWEDRAFT_31438 [Aspergillus wentii DTO 134E9]KAI9935105.1 hypothetical protein MW887_000726 [Aspergillus wentii]OJJ32547.1 hypothetical protein ASPWEDRAFT_31438 [Aspergillus wentii DTO 134E9]